MTPRVARILRQRQVATQAEAHRWRVVRHDGVVLAGAPTEAAALRTCAALSDGQPAGHVVVERRGGAR